MFPQDEITDLIVRHLSGETTAAEDARLTVWLQEKPENQAEYDEIVKLWHTSTGIRPVSPVDVEKEWLLFRSRHFEKGKVISISYRAVVKYAVAAALVIGAFAATWYYSGSEIYITGSGERLLITLNDGSEIRLSQNSELQVPRVFNWNKRDVTLSGEALFQVAKNPDKPFQIDGFLTHTRVLGTAFRLVATPDANKIEVVEGKVAYWSDHSSDTLVLVAGDAGIAGDYTLQKVKISENNALSWKNGLFAFEEAGLALILSQLQDYYVFNVRDPNNELQKSCAFSGSFSHQSLEDILQELSMVMGIQYSYADRTLTINKIDCPQ